MQLKITVAAIAVALGGLVAAAPANAGAVALTVQAGHAGHNYQEADWRGHDRRDHDSRDRDGRDRDWRDHDRRDHRDWRHHEHRYLSTQAVRSILRHRGFHHVRFVDASAPTYRALAEDFRGRRVSITVSAHSGAILRVVRLGHRHG